mgnify:CR=1 FL=1
MTIHGILKSLSAKELALTKRYYESIQRFEVQPSDTYEFDAEFPAEDGERSIAEITLDENAEIEDLYCTCRAGGLCVHLAAMMCDMEERKTVFFSGRMQE